MYKNDSFELLKNNKKRFNNHTLDALILKISDIYKKYNRNINNYTSNYKSIMENAMSKFSIANFIDVVYGGRLNISSSQSENILQIILNTQNYLNSLEGLKYIEFLSEEKRNVVFVGPNGCGKTTLLRYLISITGEEKIAYYPADRLLVINQEYSPQREYSAFVKSLESTEKYANDINNNSQTSYIPMQINQAIAMFEKRRLAELELYFNRKISKEECITEKIIKIWNDIIKDRILFFNESLQVKTTLNGNIYPLKHLSSGEKSILYFLSSILLKEEKKYYFIDEPENNLNNSIVSKLWDIIEGFLPNSVFVYLTHDSDFVASRVNSKIYWIKKYNGKNVWEFESLPENNDLPQALMVSLVGNRLPVIFCESQNETKYDTILYKILFPEYKIVAVGGCDKVVAKVKAYKETGLPQKAFGIIDRDYKSDEYLIGQMTNDIYHIPFFEIENFLLSEKIMTAICKYYFISDPENAIEKIKDFIRKAFVEQKNKWIIRKVAYTLRDYKLYDNRINSLTSLKELKEIYEKHVESIKIEELIISFTNFINEIEKEGNYNSMLKYLDNKKIISDINDVISIEGKMYDEAVFDYLKSNNTIISELRLEYFPDLE